MRPLTRVGTVQLTSELSKTRFDWPILCFIGVISPRQFTVILLISALALPISQGSDWLRTTVFERSLAPPGATR